MEKTKLDLYDLWNEIVWVRDDAEKVSLLVSSLSISSYSKNNELMFLNMIRDYSDKVIEELRTIENVLKEWVKNNG